MALSEARRRANNKYNREHMTTLGCKMRKEYAEEFKNACAAMGTSPNAVFSAAAKQLLERYHKQQAGEQAQEGGEVFTQSTSHN